MLTIEKLGRYTLASAIVGSILYFPMQLVALNFEVLAQQKHWDSFLVKWIAEGRFNFIFEVIESSYYLALLGALAGATVTIWLFNRLPKEITISKGAPGNKVRTFAVLNPYQLTVAEGSNISGIVDNGTGNVTFNFASEIKGDYSVIVKADRNLDYEVIKKTPSGFLMVFPNPKSEKVRIEVEPHEPTKKKPKSTK